MVQVEKLYFSSDEYFSNVFQAIHSAQKAIEMESYIFEADALGLALVDQLTLAAARGVKVRVLIDGVGSWNFPKTLVDRFRKSHIQLKVYHPLPFHSASKTKGFSASHKWTVRWLKRWIRLWGLINSRNHRKVIVIDHETAFVGSMNITLPQSHLKKQSWKDTGLLLKGKGVQDLTHAFNRTWIQRRFPFNRAGLRHPLPPKSTFPIRLNDSKQRREYYYSDLVQRIQTAHEKIRIQNPYFVPNRRLIRALRTAAFLGKDVRIILTHKSDLFFMPWVTTLFYPALFMAGIRIFEYLPKILHSKIVLVDDWAIVGSSNLNSRSMRHDLEVDIELTDRHCLQQLKDQLESDLSQCQEVTLSDWKKKSILVKTLGRLVYLFRYWL